jgi:hypothetical protein
MIQGTLSQYNVPSKVIEGQHIAMKWGKKTIR